MSIATVSDAPSSSHELERDVADAADADQRGAAPGLEPRQELLDRVVRGDAGVGVRRHRRRLDAGGQRQQRALVDEHVLGEAAVARQPGELVPLAVDVLPAAARHAQAAAVGGVDEHGVALRDRRHAVADRVHPAGVLVTEDDGRLDARRLHQPVDRVQVGRADAGAADLDDDVAHALGLGHRPLDELERLVVLGEQRRLHAAAVVSARGEVAVRVGVDALGDPRRERHDRQRRVHGQRARDERRVADEEPLDLVRLAVAVDHRPRRVVAHPAAALDVRRREAGPADLLRARSLEHLAAEVE